MQMLYMPCLPASITAPLTTPVPLHLPRYRGYFVPARPEKNVVEGSRPTEAFVEERRAALERYLNKLARHPAIKNSEVLPDA
jgi:hypothetical protein